MITVVGLNDLSTALIEAGNNLLNSHSSSTEELLTLLDETESLLRNVEQDPPLPMKNALTPAKNALVSIDLLSHPDSDVRVSVVSCLNEIMRITAPEAPYPDDQMKEIFRLTVEAFEKLADPSSRSYRKAQSVLDNVSMVRSSLVMLDLECDDLILDMFRKFLNIIRSDHPRDVFSSMEMIMITIIDETEQVSNDLFAILLASVKKDNQNVSPMSRSLVEKVLSRCARKLKPYIIEALKSTGTSLDMYSPVVSSICHTVFETIKAHNVVNTKEKEEDKTNSERQVEPSDSLEEKYMELSRKENRSKRPARDGTRRSNENDKLRNGNNPNLWKQSLKQVRSESTDGETELGVRGKRGRKPNSLMNPEEGYDISWLSGRRDSLKTSPRKKKQKIRSRGESSLGKVAAKKTPLPKETSPATSRSLTGSLKRSRVEMDHDSDSPSTPRLKKLASCFRDEEPPEEDSSEESFEKLEANRKIGNSSKKTRSENSLEKSQKTGRKKPIVEAKVVNSSGKRSSARWEAKRKNSQGASMDTPQSSKSKRMVSRVAARSLAEESEKRHPTRRGTTKKEAESHMNGFGEDLVGKRVNIWWPLDKTFYEGIVESYSSRKKTHKVVYSDGDSEQLNLNKERWELLEDHTCADEGDEEIDLPEGIPLSDIIRRHKVKKSKNVVEPTSSSDVRSSSITLRKKDSGKQVKRSKGGSWKANVVSEKSKEGKNLKSLKELNAETDRREEEQEVSRDVEQENEDEDEDDDSSEKQEESESKGEDDDSSEEEQEESESKGEDDDSSEEEQEESERKGEETETVEEEKQYPNSEVEGEGEDSESESESEEEPKWRETEDMEEDDEAEEREKDNETEEDDEADEREKDNETEEDDGTEEIEEDDEAEESEEGGEAEEREKDGEAEEKEKDNEAEEKEKDGEAEEKEKDDEAEEIEKDDEAEEIEKDDEAEEIEKDNKAEEREKDDEAEETEKDDEAEERKKSDEAEEIEKDDEAEERKKSDEAEEIVKDNEAEEIEKDDDDKRTSTSMSEMEKEEDEEKES